MKVERGEAWDRVFAERKGCEVVELNVQRDHVYLLVMVQPKVSISDLMGAVKGRIALRIFKQFPSLRQRPYWGNHFREPGCCVDTVDLDAEMIRKYLKFQEKRERENEKQTRLKY